MHIYRQLVRKSKSIPSSFPRPIQSLRHSPVLQRAFSSDICSAVRESNPRKNRVQASIRQTLEPAMQKWFVLLLGCCELQKIYSITIFWQCLGSTLVHDFKFSYIVKLLSTSEDTTIQILKCAHLCSECHEQDLSRSACYSYDCIVQKSNPNLKACKASIFGTVLVQSDARMTWEYWVGYLVHCVISCPYLIQWLSVRWSHICQN